MLCYESDYSITEESLASVRACFRIVNLACWEMAPRVRGFALMRVYVVEVREALDDGIIGGIGGDFGELLYRSQTGIWGGGSVSEVKEMCRRGLRERLSICV